MSVIKTQVRPGAYYDSIVLMQLQKSLLTLPGVLDAGVVMATDANKELLQQNNLLGGDASGTRPEDLLIAVRTRDDAAAKSALDRVDELLARKRTGGDEAYRPKSLESALQMLPDAQWVMVSAPGKYAGGVARDALSLGRHVFLYSDNVPIEEEIALKQTARGKGLLVMGPDCGTAIIGGVGFGFANQVRRGKIGVVGASGTGVQAVTVGIHRLGEGVSHAFGTGTNDLKDAVGAITTMQALDFLSRDAATQVIVLVSKPPSPAVAARVLEFARKSGKPVVVDFIGYAGRDESNLHFAKTLDEAAERAVELSGGAKEQGSGPLSHLPSEAVPGLRGALSATKQSRYRNDVVIASVAALPRNDNPSPVSPRHHVSASRFMRGLYSGGTLAYEAQLILRDYLPAAYSNAPLITNHQLPSPHTGQENTIVDLGAEEFMVGRLHPMIDNDLRIRRLKQEADDPSVAIILLDVVLGYGAHPDPASELAPAISDALARAAKNGRALEIVAVVIGTDQDPQNYASQVERLRDAGARLFDTHEAAVRYVGETLGKLHGDAESVEVDMHTRGAGFATKQKQVSLTRTKAEIASVAALPRNDNENLGASLTRVSISSTVAAINVGIESFNESLQAQHVPVIQVDWKPPAGGNERMMAILEKLKAKS
jgi:FdrA protein